MTDTKPCPVCTGTTDPRARLFGRLCDKHLAEAKPLTDEQIESALEEGRKARAAIDAAIEYPLTPWRGFFR